MGSQLCGFRGSHQELQNQLLQKPQIQSIIFLKYPDFLSRYMMIGQKFKLNQKYLPEAEFQSFTKNNNSILFKSTSGLGLTDTSKNIYFQGIIFEQASQNDGEQFHHYNALCYQGKFNEFQAKEQMGFAIFDNGDTYGGEWKNNMIDGYGIYTQNQNKTVYQGEFKEWKKQGKGKLVSNVEKKFTYEGDFKNDKIHGQGRIQFEEGSKYIGSFKNGFQDGYGVYETPSMRYDGTWKRGLMSGAGTAIWYSEKKQIISKYTGQYLDGKKHGFGQYEGKNGKLLRGHWFQGRFNPGVNSYIIQ